MMPADAAAALLLFAADPLGSGLILKGPPCPARDAILAALAAHGTTPLRRVPLSIDADRLTGGVDIGASLAAGRLVTLPGLLQGAPSVLVLTMAERWDARRAAPLSIALDQREIGLVALDEGTAEEPLAPALADRCAYRIDLLALPDDFPTKLDASWPAQASAELGGVEAGEAITGALVQAALALGVAGMRGTLLAVRCARLAAARAGRSAAAEEDAALAARLVLAPRATMTPPAQEAPAPPDDPEPGPEPNAQDADEAQQSAGRALQDLVLDAARVVLPPNLLALPAGQRRSARSTGRAGQLAKARTSGRPVGSRIGLPRGGNRLDLIATLRAAAPWQTLRNRTASDRRIRIGSGDLRIRRCKPRTATTTIFAVDASGSQALARLGEAKGAVELLLADCYVRRDSVALIAFRGQQAELLLPPTRAPARARRCLAAVAGGGGTPLAAGLVAASMLADAATRRGETPTIVVLTDGQANIAQDGRPGRAAAQQDAMAAARAINARGHRALLIDTAARRQHLAEALAEAMNALYVPLPRADADALSTAVRAARQ